MSDLAALRRRLLEAREARQALIARACGDGHSVVFASTNIPGRDKVPAGAAYLLNLASSAVTRGIRAVAVDRGEDAVGPWVAFAVNQGADGVKRAAIGFESTLPSGRLIDLDVYDPAGAQVDRASIGAPPRTCLVCDRPAFECIRLSRHPADDVSAAVARLLLGGLASALVDGVRTELALTPKPGLVDRHDNGSHPDLSFEAMSRSIDLLPTYLAELIAAAVPLDLPACVAAGRRAERRMVDTIGTNGHKGYIFLAGLVLLAAAAGRQTLRPEIAALARRILVPRASLETGAGQLTHGGRAREDLGLGGIYREALDGLPSVFDHGLPVLSAEPRSQRSTSASDRDGATSYLLMAVLMQTVEDTTAVHRCGPSGLARLRADGVRLQRRIEGGKDYLPWLVTLNDEYRRLNMTMGGVADCMALCFALREWLPSPLVPNP